jgi:hypothetical protein
VLDRNVGALAPASFNHRLTDQYKMTDPFSINASWIPS